MTRVRRGIWAGIGLVVALVLGFLLYAWLGNRPQDLPWTKLDLAEPVGLFTGRKITGLTHDVAQCRALLDHAGVRYEVLPELSDGDHCGYADGVRFMPGGSRRTDYLPEAPKISCPVAAGLSVWEWEVIQPAALKHFGKRVSAIEHLGSYSCRHIVGSGNEGWSQHSTADAIDISGFRLEDATRITVRKDWNGSDPERAAFLREVRKGACGVFSIVLSPDYNAAHRDHLHLDQAPWGEFSWRSCR